LTEKKQKNDFRQSKTLLYAKGIEGYRQSRVLSFEAILEESETHGK